MTTPPPSATLPGAVLDTAEQNLRDVLRLAVEHTDTARALVVSDAQSELVIALTRAYRRCLPGATFVDFDDVAPEAVGLAEAHAPVGTCRLSLSWTCRSVGLGSDRSSSGGRGLDSSSAPPL